MTPIPIAIPPGAKIANYLYPQMELDDLTQDIVTIALPNGYCIDAGWFPEHDPNGRYVIRVFFETWDCQELSEPVETKDGKELVVVLEKLAKSFARMAAPTRRTEQTV